jgi:hypothetical protein
MNSFTRLREQARLKRDKAITEVRAEYAATLKKIAELEQDLLGAKPARHRSIASCINLVIPTDRAFTTVDIMTALEALDAGRVWRKRSIDNHISRLRDRGIVRRLRKSQNTEPALYARVGVVVEPLPFEDMTLREVIAAILKDRPLRQTELAVVMLEAGYRTTMDVRALRTAVGVELRRGPFEKCADGRWRAIGSISEPIFAQAQKPE